MPLSEIAESLPRSVALTAVLTARQYLRVSQDKRGKKRSVKEQAEENIQKAAAHGITILGEPYTDNDMSASRYATKERKDFARLISDLETGNYPEDLLVLWENSRGSRQTGEWVRLIDLCETHDKRIFITSHGRIYDPVNGRDRRALLEDAVDSEYETYKTHLRIKRDTAASATEGRPHGKAPHGYKPIYNEKTGELINWVEDPEESIVPKELFRRLKAGHSLVSITRDFEAAGYLNRSGAPFSRQHLRVMATRHAYAGIRVHHPRSRGQRGTSEVKATLHNATWDGLVSKEDFWKVQRIISDPKRRKSKNGRAKHVLTITIRCDKCGGPMKWENAKGTPSYKCRDKGCCYIDQQGVDAIVIGTVDAPGMILMYLESDAVYADFQASPEEEARIAEDRAEIERLTADKNEMSKAIPLSLEESRRIEKGVQKLESMIAEIRARIDAATLPAVLQDLVSPGVGVAKRWQAAPIEAQRKVASMLLTSQICGEVRILPCPSKRRLPATQRVKFARSE
ncbi:recombinase family protein [Streptomyces mayteni]